MIDLISIGSQIAERRKSLKLSQSELSRLAGLSRATLDALENGRARELGFAKVSRLLAALGLELTLHPRIAGPLARAVGLGPARQLFRWLGR